MSLGMESHSGRRWESRSKGKLTKAKSLLVSIKHPSEVGDPHSTSWPARCTSCTVNKTTQARLGSSDDLGHEDHG
jgi:hypothetical protein